MSVITTQKNVKITATQKEAKSCAAEISISSML